MSSFTDILTDGTTKVTGSAATALIQRLLDGANKEDRAPIILALQNMYAKDQASGNTKEAQQISDGLFRYGAPSQPPMTASPILLTPAPLPAALDPNAPKGLLHSSVILVALTSPLWGAYLWSRYR